MVYGYSKRTVNEYGLVELREITFGLPPGDLRDVAGFLLAMADELEDACTDENWHRHIEMHVNGWRSRHPDLDIIVVRPSGHD